MTAIAVPGNEHIAFNECLAVLYRDGQGMAYHDDGELGEGLGIYQTLLFFFHGKACS